MSRVISYIVLALLIQICDGNVEIMDSDDYQVRLVYNLDLGTIRFAIHTEIDDVQTVILDYSITGEMTNYSDRMNLSTTRRKSWWAMRKSDLMIYDKDVISFKLTLLIFDSDTIYKSLMEFQELTRAGSILRPIGTGGPRGPRRFRTTTEMTETIEVEEIKKQYIRACLDFNTTAWRCFKRWYQEHLIPTIITATSPTEHVQPTERYEVPTTKDKQRRGPNGKPGRRSRPPPPPPPPPRPESDRVDDGLSQSTIIIISTVIPFIVMNGIIIIVCILVKKRRNHRPDTRDMKRVNNAAYDDTAFTERPLPPTRTSVSSIQREERPLSRSSLYENPGIYEGAVYDEIVQNCMYEELPSPTCKIASSTFTTNLKMSDRPLPGINTMGREQSEYIDPDRSDDETYCYSATPEAMHERPQSNATLDGVYEHPQPPRTEMEIYEKLNKKDSFVSIY